MALWAVVLGRRRSGDSLLASDEGYARTEVHKGLGLDRHERKQMTLHIFHRPLNRFAIEKMLLIGLFQDAALLGSVLLVNLFAFCLVQFGFLRSILHACRMTNNSTCANL